jgi:hypothetical protein
VTQKDLKNKEQISFIRTKNKEQRKVRRPYRVFIEDGEADCARGINIRVKKACWKFALGWFTRIILTEMNGDWKIATFPISLHRST